MSPFRSLSQGASTAIDAVFAEPVMHQPRCAGQYGGGPDPDRDIVEVEGVYYTRRADVSGRGQRSYQLSANIDEGSVVLSFDASAFAQAPRHGDRFLVRERELWLEAVRVERDEVARIHVICARLA